MSAAGSARDGDGVPDVDPVVHAPARLAIMTLLRVTKTADFAFLQKHTGLTRGNLSSHLAKLEAAGYIRVEKTFVRRVPRTLLGLTAEGRAAFRRYRQRMQQTLDDLPD